MSVCVCVHVCCQKTPKRALSAKETKIRVSVRVCFECHGPIELCLYNLDSDRGILLHIATLTASFMKMLENVYKNNVCEAASDSDACQTCHSHSDPCETVRRLLTAVQIEWYTRPRCVNLICLQNLNSTCSRYGL